MNIKSVKMNENLQARFFYSEINDDVAKDKSRLGSWSSILNSKAATGLL